MSEHFEEIPEIKPRVPEPETVPWPGYVPEVGNSVLEEMNREDEADAARQKEIEEIIRRRDQGHPGSYSEKQTREARESLSRSLSEADEHMRNALREISDFGSHPAWWRVVHFFHGREIQKEYQDAIREKQRAQWWFEHSKGEKEE